MKKAKTLFWIATTIIFIFEGVLVALTSHTQMSIDGITSLGYPLYFVTLLAIFKVLGSLALFIPRVPSRVKEWAYACFGVEFLFALLSLWIVAGFGPELILPVVFLIILWVSYSNYHKIRKMKGLPYID